MQPAKPSAPEQLYAAPPALSDWQIADSLPQLVWTCTADGQCDYLSRQWVQYTGISARDQLKFGWINQVHPDDQERVISLWNQNAAAGANLDVEFRIRRFDGVYRWFKTRAVAVRDADNKIDHWFGSNTDIDDLKQAETALRESEELFRTTFEQAAVGIGQFSLDGCTLRLNQKLCDILGYTRDELMRLKFIDITWPADTDLHLAQNADLLAGETDSLRIEKRYIHKNGRPVWANVTASLRRREDGSPHYYISVVEDISARKRAEESLRLLARAGEMLGSTLNADATVRELIDLLLPDWSDWSSVQTIEETESGATIRNVAMRHVDPRKNEIGLELVNRFAGDPIATGPFLATLRQGPLLIADPGPDYMIAPGANPDFVRLIRSMEIRSVILMPLLSNTAQDSEGNPRLLGAFGCHITESDKSYDEQDLALLKEIGRRVGVAIDRANLYAEAQVARRAAEDANRAKDEFLSIVSHELRTPLTPIKGWVGLLRGPMNEEAKRAALDIIERNLNIQVQIISDILDTSRITAGKLNLNLNIISLIPLIQESAEVVHGAAKEKNIAFFVSFLADEILVQGDALRLHQIIWNLLTNALKFTPAGGRIELQMRSKMASEPFVEIIVRDNGIGIKSEFLPHIFERFLQADSSHTRQHGGLGLGLNIVHNLVEMHGGSVEAHSAGENKGATFTVRLPLYVEK